MLDLHDLLDRPMAPQAVHPTEIAVADALPLTQLDRLLDPTPEKAETGWCKLPDGTQYVAVRTPMPGVTGEMVDWWFDWHPDDPLRYRIWHPKAHISNRVERPVVAGAKKHHGTVHHPVEDVGTGVEKVRIAFVTPREMGFSRDEAPGVATIVCGYAGDDTRRMRHTVMTHVFLDDADGVVLRSRFWLGAALRPYAPGAVAGPIAKLINRPAVRRALLPKGVAPGLAQHCAEEYANLAALLPEVHAAYA